MGKVRPKKQNDRITQNAREIRNKFRSVRWNQGFSEGIAHTLKAVRECLAGRERFIDGGCVYPLPVFAQANLNDFLEQLRTAKASASIMGTKAIQKTETGEWGLVGFIPDAQPEAPKTELVYGDAASARHRAGGFYCQNCSRVLLEKEGDICPACRKLLMERNPGVEFE